MSAIRPYHNSMAYNIDRKWYLMEYMYAAITTMMVHPVAGNLTDFREGSLM
jgi:hypothetical protein